MELNWERERERQTDRRCDVYMPDTRGEQPYFFFFYVCLFLFIVCCCYLLWQHCILTVMLIKRFEFNWIELRERQTDRRCDVYMPDTHEGSSLIAFLSLHLPLCLPCSLFFLSFFFLLSFFLWLWWWCFFFFLRLFFDFLSESENSVDEDEELDEEDEKELDGLEDEEKEDAPGDELAEEDLSIVPPSSVSTT